MAGVKQGRDGAVGILTLRDSDDRLLAGGAVSGGAVLLTLATALKLHQTGHPEDLFMGGRLDFPVTYVNAPQSPRVAKRGPATPSSRKNSRIPTR